jgi:hypothetical protein
MVHYDFLKAYFLTGKSERVTKGEEGEIAYLFEVGLSSVKLRQSMVHSIVN